IMQFRYFNNTLNKVVKLAKKLTLPGFDRVPLFDVGSFFIKAIMKGSVATRASSVAFNLFLAIFPAIIFLFTLIPYIPIENFQFELLTILKNIMPQKVFYAVEGAITDIIMQPRSGLLSIGFLAALYFSTNGINAMIGAFNATYLTIETRNWWNQRLISLVIVVILFILVTAAIALITFGNIILDYLINIHLLEKNITYYLLTIGQWLVILALFFFALSILYYLAPAKKSKWRFISAGASLASLLIIITSLGFSFYVNNFGQYNKLYGSLGTLIVLLLWLYFNSWALLLGFELNTSIRNARSDKKNSV
ncbi:MAG: YihY/virulence factor BrkB family protein, partial [Bacteroidia bacterium]|nr:YihY/virulence factor BrkB family protein [Bacteroidia bacterium]